MALFDAAQAQLQANRRNHRSGGRATTPSLLAGLIFDGEGRPMTPRHAAKGSRRYRYYVTAPSTADRRMAASAWKVPAGELDQLVRERLAGWLALPRSVLELVDTTPAAPVLPALLTAATELAGAISVMPISELRTLLLDISAQVQVDRDQVLITSDTAALLAKLGRPTVSRDPGRRCTIAVPAALTRRGQELRLAFAPDDRDAPTQVDTKLLGLLAKGVVAYCRLLAGGVAGKIKRGHLTRLARLTTLAPDITSAILDGRQPVQLTARTLLRLPELPLAWGEQRTLLGFA